MLRYSLLILQLSLILTPSSTYQLFFDYNQQYLWPDLCVTGKKQSPIDIQFHKAQKCPHQIKYSVSQTQGGSQIIVHHIQDTKDLQNPFEEQTFLKLVQNNTQNNYKSLQFHWHTPSEHTINGQKFDLELHIVHKSTGTDGRVAVTGLLFNIVNNGVSTIFGKLNLAQTDKESYKFPFQLNDKLVFHYKGSLTTPPCSEIVDWFVYLDSYPISKFQLQKIKAAKNNGKPNSRKVHKLNQRQLYFLSPKCSKQ